MKIIKKIAASLAAAAMLGSAVPLSGMAAENVSVSMGEDIACAKGQKVAIPININANNDFESAELEFKFAEPGTADMANIKILGVNSLRSGLNISYSDLNVFTPKGYIMIELFSSGSTVIEDGTMAEIVVEVPDSGVDVSELSLSTVILATQSNQEYKSLPGSSISFDSSKLLGDVNDDGVVNIRDAATLAKRLASRRVIEVVLPYWSDYNLDSNINVRDCAAIAKMCAEKMFS